MWLAVIAAIALVYAFARAPRDPFDISPGSRSVVDRLRSYRYVNTDVPALVELESRLVECVRRAVHGGEDTFMEAQSLSETIISRWPMLSFAHHFPHLQQISRPDVRLNPFL